MRSSKIPEIPASEKQTYTQLLPRLTLDISMPQLLRSSSAPAVLSSTSEEAKHFDGNDPRQGFQNEEFQIFCDVCFETKRMRNNETGAHQDKIDADFHETNFMKQHRLDQRHR